MDVGSQLQALADPTRRAVFDIVRVKSSSVREITDALPVSQPAVSQHLRVLRDAELVTSEAIGARRIYRADRRGVDRLRAWIESLWDDVLDAYVDAANELAANELAARSDDRRTPPNARHPNTASLNVPANTPSPNAASLNEPANTPSPNAPANTPRRR